MQRRAFLAAAVGAVSTTRWLTAPARAVSLTAVTPDSLVTAPSADLEAQVRKKLGPSWKVADTEHFRVHSDASPRYHRLIAGLLEQFFREVHPRFFTRPMARLDVFVVDGGKDYEAFMQARGLGAEATGYGVYVYEQRAFFARRRFPDGRLSGLGTLFHEAIHALVHAEMGERRIPPWLNEGFAALFEQGRIVEGKWIYGNPNPWREKAFRPEFEAGRVPTLARYFGLSEDAFYAVDKHRMHYNVGRSLCLYLLRQRGEGVLRNFVRAGLMGGSGREALEHATGMSVEQVEAAWRENVQKVNWGGDYLERAAGKGGLRILEEGARRHPDYGLLRVTLAEQYAWKRQYGPALAHAQAALGDPRLTEPQRAHRVLAEAHWDRNPKQAMQALERVVALQPWVDTIDEVSFKDLATLRKQAKDRKGAAQILAQLAELRRADGQRK